MARRPAVTHRAVMLPRARARELVPKEVRNLGTGRAGQRVWRRRAPGAKGGRCRGPKKAAPPHGGDNTFLLETAQAASPHQKGPEGTETGTEGTRPGQSGTG